MTTKALKEKGVSLRILSMTPRHRHAPTGKLMVNLLGSIAERELMLERQREGIAKAKADGKYRGRQPTARRKAKDAPRLRAEGTSPRMTSKMRWWISLANVFRILAENR